jgi:hypothetical protein
VFDWGNWLCGHRVNSLELRFHVVIFLNIERDAHHVHLDEVVAAVKRKVSVSQSGRVLLFWNNPQASSSKEYATRLADTDLPFYSRNNFVQVYVVGIAFNIQEYNDVETQF